MSLLFINPDGGKDIAEIIVGVIFGVIVITIIIIAIIIFVIVKLDLFGAQSYCLRMIMRCLCITVVLCKHIHAQLTLFPLLYKFEFFLTLSFFINKSSYYILNF